MADVRDGVGPYLSVFLKGGQHWQPGEIGIAMAASSIAAALCQIPTGVLVDSLKIKRLLVAASGLMVAVGCLLIAIYPASSPLSAPRSCWAPPPPLFLPPSLPSALAWWGRKKLDLRISRNESFNHGGNFTAAALAGGLGQYLGYQWIFYLVCAFAIASAAVITLINPREIDHEVARGGESSDAKPIAFSDLLKRGDLLIFLASVILFHFGNAAMLPMAGQVLAQTHPGSDAITLSACIIAAQCVMIGVAWGVGRAVTAGYGRKTIFLVALAVLPVRGLLFSFTSNPYGVVVIQLLDGVAAGIFGVIAILMASDLMRGTGRFNLAQGLVALCVGIGAGLSNLSSGFVVQYFGYPTGFLFLATIAAAALVFFAMLMHETKENSAESPEKQKRLSNVLSEKRTSR